MLKPGTILVERKNGLWGFIAWLALGTNYQHASIVDETGLRVYEAVWNGIRCNPINFKRLSHYDIGEPLCGPLLCLAALEQIRTRVGESYGLLQVALMVLHRRVGLPEPQVRGLYCSELIRWGFMQVGFNFTPGRAVDDTTPEDLRRSPRIRWNH